MPLGWKFQSINCLIFTQDKIYFYDKQGVEEPSQTHNCAKRRIVSAWSIYPRTAYQCFQTIISYNIHSFVIFIPGKVWPSRYYYTAKRI